MRDSEEAVEYFTRRIAIRKNLVEEKMPVAETFHRVEGRPGIASQLCMYTLQICILRYGRGDKIDELKPSVLEWIKANEIQGRIVSRIPPERKAKKPCINE